MPSKKPYIQIRTTEELINRFQEICDKEKRSMSNMGEYIIEKYVEEYETQQTEKQKSSAPTTKPKNININNSRGVITGDNNGSIEVK